MKPIFLKSQDEFRKWLEENHESASEILAGFYKVSTDKPSMRWSESVDQGLCFGWIDGVRRSIDESSYSIRFTLRKPKSNWSAVNIRKVAELTERGLMRPAGLAAFEKREENRSATYAYENRPKKFDKEFEDRFKRQIKAWDFFHSQAPSYRRTTIYWVMSANQGATRISRLEKLIAASAGAKRV